MDKAFVEGEERLIAKITRGFAGFWNSITGVSNLIENSMAPGGRIGSDSFFKYTTSFKKKHTDSLGGQEVFEVIRVARKLHFTKAIEQEYNLRYNCSRRHNLMTAACEAKRVSDDLSTIAKVR